MKEIILKMDDDVFNKLLSFISLLPKNKIQIVKKRKDYRKFYGILDIKDSKIIDKEIRDEWYKRLSF